MAERTLEGVDEFQPTSGDNGIKSPYIYGVFHVTTGALWAMVLNNETNEVAWIAGKDRSYLTRGAADTAARKKCLELAKLHELKEARK